MLDEALALGESCASEGTILCGPTPGVICLDFVLLRVVDRDPECLEHLSESLPPKAGPNLTGLSS